MGPSLVRAETCCKAMYRACASRQASGGIRSWRSCASPRELERSEDRAGGSEKRRELVRRQGSVLQKEDDGLPPDVEDDDAEDLALVEPVGIRVECRRVRQRAER